MAAPKPPLTTRPTALSDDRLGLRICVVLPLGFDGADAGYGSSFTIGGSSLLKLTQHTRTARTIAMIVRDLFFQFHLV
jgi:hypothetical protein